MKHLFILCTSLLCVSTLYAQSLWPGDVNNNGIVNGVDILYWGYALEETGPAREGATTNWQAQPFQEWDEEFPNDLNVAHADVDGDGEVALSDLEALQSNFNRFHENMQPDQYLQGTVDQDPLFLLEPVQSTANPGDEIAFNIILGADNSNVPQVFGITFLLKYDRELVVPNSLEFSMAPDGWYNSPNAEFQIVNYQEPQEGWMSITMVRTDHKHGPGKGLFGTLRMQLRPNISGVLPAAFHLGVVSALRVNKFLQASPVAYSNAQTIIAGDVDSPPCPRVIAPVCGSDGLTYLNSCYAEVAGVTDYTPGVCYSDCIDPDQINPNTACPEIYQPVCGCNGVTYSNSCEAEAAGVQSYQSGPCNTSISCYDPSYVVTAAGTVVNANNGTIGLLCDIVPDTGGGGNGGNDDDDDDNGGDDDDDDDDGGNNGGGGNNPTSIEVCGCNGVTYANACTAEASGIVSYTAGACDDTCIDPTEIDPNADCNNNYDPVCGCNDVTYINACLAEAAGVQSFSTGPCGGTTSWCNEAVPITCGDFMANETTVGTVNNLTDYPGCVNASMLGPDRVYVINKTTAGDLQIGMEIITPGLDLDIFLLSDNCNQVTCLASSTSNNQNSNNEGILYEDAPIGTYYIVVDGQFAHSAGQFRLEVNCGYLLCNDAISLSCGESYTGNTIDGNDDISLYGCTGNVFNVENNGPEKVHQFTVTTSGQVNIQLTDLNTNLELFLLRSCDRGECITFSQNLGASDESITTFLNPGTYYVVVDGYNGAAGPYTLQVNCANACTLELDEVAANAASCGQSNGSIQVASSGGQAGYLVQLRGPVERNFSTDDNDYTIPNLPPGDYIVQQTDANGCTDEAAVTVSSAGSLNMGLQVTDVNCGTLGSILVNVSNGNAPYQVLVTGPENGSGASNNSTFNIINLPAGAYTIQVVDAGGCSAFAQVSIVQNSDGFSFTPTPNDADCGGLGSIRITTQGGTGPYQLSVSGPITGSLPVNADIFNILDLPAGTYTITLEDANGCVHTRLVTVEDLDLSIDAIAQNGSCEANGAILVNINSGTNNYTIAWDGPVSGNINTNQTSYLIENLPPGNYTVTVEGGDNCEAFQVLEVESIEGLSSLIFPIDGDCLQLAGIYVEVDNGTAPYTISWTGATTGEMQTDETTEEIYGFTSGSYVVTIEDANGCDNTHAFSFEPFASLEVALTPSTAACAQDGTILISFTGGSPNYTVKWDGPAAGEAVTGSAAYTINGLPAGDYTITVEDVYGCTDTATTTVDSDGEVPEVSFSYSVSEALASFTSLGSVGTYSWDFGDNTSSTVANPTHTYALAGEYNVCLTVTTDCGADTYCEFITVDVGSMGSAVLSIGDGAGPTGAVVALPVTLTEVAQLVALSGSLQSNNSAIASIVGIAPGVIDPQYSLTNQTFSYFGNGVSITEDSVLFYVQVMLNGEIGSTAVLSFTGSPLPIEVAGIINGIAMPLPFIMESGQVSITGLEATLTGDINTYWGAGVEDVAVSIFATGTTSSSTTDEEGEYIIPGLIPGLDYRIKPSKNNAPANGLSSFALYVGQQFILGNQPPQITSPYQIVAGDANCNDAFTLADLLLIQQVLIGAAESFSNCPSWVFLPRNEPLPTNFTAYNVFPYNDEVNMLITKDTTVDFVGVKIGDILGEANPNLLTQDETEIRSREQLKLLATDRSYRAGEVIELPIYADQFTNVVSLQLGLDYDAQSLEFLSCVGPEDTPLANLVAGTPQAGALGISWFSTAGKGVRVDADEVLFTLRFKARTAVPKLSDRLRMNSQILRDEAYTEQLTPLQVVWDWQTTGGATPQNVFALHQNYPNPFFNQTTIAFNLPETMLAELTIQDPTGRIVHRKTGTFDAGRNQIILQDLTLDAGVYFYTLKAGAHVQSRSMVIVK